MIKKKDPKILGEVIKDLIQSGRILPNYKLNDDERRK